MTVTHGILVGCNQGRLWHEARSHRSLAAAGLRSHGSADLEFSAASLLLLRAGGWLRDPQSFKPPPASATGKPVVAFGVPRIGPAAEHWRVLFEKHGGDFAGVAQLPQIHCIWASDGRLIEGFRDLDAIVPTADARWIHWPALDAEFDPGLRAIQIVTSLQSGGAERVAWDLHDVLPRAGVTSLLVTLGRALRSPLPEPANHVALAGMGNAERAAAVARIALRFGADVLHGHLIHADDAHAFSRTGVPLAMTIHNTSQAWPDGIASLQAGDASLLIGCAEQVSDELRKSGTPIPIRTVWNGIDPGRATSIERRIDPAWLTLACIANPRPQKRLHFLPPILAAVDRELARRSDPRRARLILAGEASARSESAQACVDSTHAAADRLGVSDRIEWTDGRRAVADVLAETDVLVCTSLHEGLSLAQLEALSAGVRLVTTDVSGTEEIGWRNDAVTRLPIDATPEQFATAIVDAADQKTVAGVQAVRRDFTRERAAARCASLYQSLHLPADGRTIWFITNNLSPGGAQSSLRRLVKSFRSDGMPVRVAVLQEEADFPTPGREDLLAGGIEVTILPPARTIDAGAAVDQLIRAMGVAPPAAVVFWNVIPVYKVLLAETLLHARVYDVSPGEMFFASLDRYFANPRPGLACRTALQYGRRLAGVVVKYAAEAEQARRVLGAPVTVVPNGIALPPEPVPARVPDGRFVIGTAARINPQKRLEDLIDAYRLAFPRLPPSVLKIAGGVEPECDAYAAELRVRAEGLPIEWLGDVRDIAGFHRQLDLFAMISDPAGCPNASLEALAAGLPVIASDVGGASEQVIDGVTGRLTPTRDAAALAAAMVELANDPELRGRLAAAGRVHVAARFSLEQMTKAYAELFGAVIEDRDASIGRDSSRR